MLSTGGIQVERRGIRNVSAGVVRNDGDVVANLALVRITFERIKRIAHRNVSRPSHAGVCAIGIEELGLKIVSCIARIIPNGIEPAIWRHRKRAKPMPLVCGGIVIDFHRRAKGRAATMAARPLARR